MILPIIRGSAREALLSTSTDINAPEYAPIIELMNTVDEYIPTPERMSDNLPFLMPVEDVFSISGRGTVATGRVERGVIKMNEEVEIIGLTTERKKTVVTGIEMFHKLLDMAEAGDNIGALLRGIQKNEVERGQVLCKPGSVHSAHQVRRSGLRPDRKRGRSSEAVLLRLSSAVLLQNDRRYRSSSSFPRALKCASLGDNVEMTVELITPIAIEKGLRLAIREGGRTVGSGRRFRNHRIIKRTVFSRGRFPSL